MDESYVKVKGQWMYQPCAVDKDGDKIDCYFSSRRNKKAALTFFKKAIGSASKPTVINIDKSSSNTAALVEINNELPKSKRIKIQQNKHFNNIVEQGHRFIKRITMPMLGFKSIHSAGASLSEIELYHMLRKGQHEVLQTSQFSSSFIH